MVLGNFKSHDILLKAYDRAYTCCAIFFFSSCLYFLLFDFNVYPIFSFSLNAILLTAHTKTSIKLKNKLHIVIQYHYVTIF